MLLKTRPSFVAWHEKRLECIVLDDGLSVAGDWGWFKVDSGVAPSTLRVHMAAIDALDRGKDGAITWNPVDCP